MRRSRWPIAGLLLLAAACGYADDETRPYRPPLQADVSGPNRGATLYERDCGWCHGARGEGTQFGPDLVTGTNGPALTHFMLSSGRMPLDYPEQRMARRTVAYSEDEIDDIVDYVSGFGQPGPDIPEIDHASADVGLGVELYQENCAACHSTTGIGGALTEGTRVTDEPGPGRRRIVIPPVTDATAVQVAEAIRVGPGTMPVFGEETFDHEDLEAIVAYVEYLKDPDDRGGASVGRIGPVAEGAIGWIVGLGLLLIFIRWIGTKRGDP